MAYRSTLMQTILQSFGIMMRKINMIIMLDCEGYTHNFVVLQLDDYTHSSCLFPLGISVELALNS